MIQLNISTKPAKLELSSTTPVLNMKTTPPKIQLSTQPAIVEIHRTDGKLEMDFTPFRYSIGLKTNTDLRRDLAKDGKQKLLEAIGNIAQAGDRMARIETKEDAIVNISAESNFQEPLDITWAHLEPPIIHYEPGKLEFNPIDGKVNLELERGTVELDPQRGQVIGRMTQYQSIRFWTTEKKVDTAV